MISEETTYHSMPLFSWFDKNVTGNYLSVDQFIYGDKYGLKATKLKFHISNYHILL